MVPSDWDILLQAGEDTLGVVSQRGCLAMEPLSGRANLSTVDIDDALPGSQM
jgi:hypothetical protein